MKGYNVGWGFTKACNLNCLHCYNSSGGSRGPDELTLDEAIKIVGTLKKNGVKTINYGTGESGLVPEFWKIVEVVSKEGIIQGLTTSGWSVNKNTISKIKRYMNDVDVSLDYANEREHNWFRDNKLAWRWAINALDLLKKHKVPFSIVVCLTSKNCQKKNLQGLLDISKRYGCELRINWFKPTGRGKQNKQFKLKIRQVNSSFRYIIQNSIIKAIPDPYFASLLGINRRSGCPCGKDSFRITPNGKVVPCVYLTKEMDNLNIKDTSFKKLIVSEPFKKIRNRKLSFCKGCEHYKICKGGCASRAFLEYGSMDEPDAFCYKLHGLRKNPLKGIRYDYEPEGIKVHDNYLCTMIVKAK